MNSNTASSHSNNKMSDLISSKKGKPITNFIFDLDGTLIDSSGDIFACARKTFQLNKIPLKEESLSTKIIGPPLVEMVRRLCPEPENEDLVQKLTQDYRNFYDASNLPLTCLYPGVAQTLKSLKEAGNKIFLATNKRYKPTVKILANLNIDFFDEVTSPDFQKPTRQVDYEKKDLLAYLVSKYHLAIEQTLMVGDTINDLRAARLNKMPVAIVQYGYGDLTELLLLNPDYFITQVGQILSLSKIKG